MNINIQRGEVMPPAPWGPYYDYVTFSNLSSSNYTWSGYFKMEYGATGVACSISLYGGSYVECYATGGITPALCYSADNGNNPV